MDERKPADTESREGEPIVSPGWPRYVGLKYVCDWVLAVLLLIVSAPVILLAALVVRLTSCGPAFYSQVRLGRRT